MFLWEHLTLCAFNLYSYFNDKKKKKKQRKNDLNWCTRIYIFLKCTIYTSEKLASHKPPPTEFLQEMCNEEYVFCFNFFSSFKLFHLSGKYGTHQALSSWKVYMLAHFPFPNLYLYLSKYLSNFARPPHRPRGYLYIITKKINVL